MFFIAAAAPTLFNVGSPMHLNIRLCTIIYNFLFTLRKNSILIFFFVYQLSILLDQVLITRLMETKILDQVLISDIFPKSTSVWLSFVMFLAYVANKSVQIFLFMGWGDMKQAQNVPFWIDKKCAFKGIIRRFTLNMIHSGFITS